MRPGLVPGRLTYWGKKARRQRQQVEIGEETLRVLTGDGEVVRAMEEARQRWEAHRARIEAGGAPAAVKGKRTWVRKRKRGARVNRDALAAISARQMEKHRGG